MAQRAVAIATRYSSCLSNACDSDLFSNGRASWQRPFAARSMACSAEVETAAAGDDFRATWAKRGAAEHAIDLAARSEEHTSELQSRQYLVCRLLLEKKKTNTS